MPIPLSAIENAASRSPGAGPRTWMVGVSCPRYLMALSISVLEELNAVDFEAADHGRQPLGRHHRLVLFDGRLQVAEGFRKDDVEVHGLARFQVSDVEFGVGQEVAEQL